MNTRLRLVHPAERSVPAPRIVVDWLDESIAIDVLGAVDLATAEAVLRIVDAIDRAVGMEDFLVRLDPADGITRPAWRLLVEAGLQPADPAGGRLVLRPAPESARGHRLAQ